MKTKEGIIVSAFPGSGKTEFAKRILEVETFNYNSVLDLDSADYNWVEGQYGTVRNPNFVKDYVDEIELQADSYDFVLVSSHEEVLEEMYQRNLLFVMVAPDKLRKQEFLDNYHERGSHPEFIDLIDKNWDDFLDSYFNMYEAPFAMYNYTLESGKFLCDIAGDIVNDWTFDEESNYDKYLQQLADEEYDDTYPCGCCTCCGCFCDDEDDYYYDNEED